MATTLTPAGLREIEDLLASSRRNISQIYREWRAGVSPQSMAEERGHDDLKRVRENLAALRIVFGRETLPKRGNGRQLAINEAQYWLNSDYYLSPEVQEHFEHILKKAEKTNTRRADTYEVPTIPTRSVYQQARDATTGGDEAGIYVVSKAAFMRESAAHNRPPLVKIGWSNNVWDRLSGLQTWEPERLEILRIFPCRNPNVLEAKIHICLDTLGLAYEAGGGKEWFTADLSLIDALAAGLGLEDRKD